MESWEEHYREYFGKNYAYECEVKNKLTERDKKSFDKKLENAYKKEFYPIAAGRPTIFSGGMKAALFFL